MKIENVYNRQGDDGHSFYDYDFVETINDAMNTASETDGEATHYVHLEDGRAIASVRVECEILTDGSKVCTIYLKPTE